MRNLKELEQIQMKSEEQQDRFFTSLTTMAKNSEVLRCSVELKKAFKYVPTYYHSVTLENKGDEMEEYLSSL
jgi:adenylate cyclase class IV